MKVTEKSQNGFSRFSIPFKRGVSHTAKTFCPVADDEPINVFYVRSGWEYGYPTFHVIVEYGDFEQTDYRFMSAAQLAEWLGVGIEEVLSDIV